LKEEQDFTILCIPIVPVAEAFDSLGLSAHTVSISMSMTFEDIPTTIPPEDKTDFLSFSMSLEMSLSMSIPDFGEDGVGDCWWLKSSMSYPDHLATEEYHSPSSACQQMMSQCQFKKHLMASACQHMLLGV
jgi:hypothetical protein